MGIDMEHYQWTLCIDVTSKTCRAARTCCAGRALALSASQSVHGPGPARRYMACRGWPAGCMLGDGARVSASFDP